MEKNSIYLQALSFLKKNLLRNASNPSFLKGRVSHARSATHMNNLRHTSLLKSKQKDASNSTLVFHFEGALLKSSSMFPYFMLVAFEGGGFLRALTLFLVYPLLCLLSKELRVKIIIFICFFGIRVKSFRIGRAVLPKFFLEDVGCEGFDVVMSCEWKIAVTDLPRIMVEEFLKDYLGIPRVVGRELKVVCGYYVGLMEEKKAGSQALQEICGGDQKGSSVIGIGCFDKPPNHHLFASCKETYWVTEADKSKWSILPRERYPRPLIFHDGRLAFRPTLPAMLAMYMWFPLGIFVFITRYIVGLLLPYSLSSSILAFTGTRVRVKKPSSFRCKNKKDKKGTLYVCNHRTLLDPIYIAVAINRRVSAVTYSLSKFNEAISPIRTVRLTRDRQKDQEVMAKELSHGDLVVCPEGTTCREPYLLRFSPLFADMCDDIVPVAIEVQVPMFYGSTASGLKVLDPVSHFLNPCPIYKINILEKLQDSDTCKLGHKSSFEVANHVQDEIAKALRYECTKLTRKDKYMVLAGNEGIV